jgi:8-oxo-dGTP pyrophosphatase MutT (NUDIX family)
MVHPKLVLARVRAAEVRGRIEAHKADRAKEMLPSGPGTRFCCKHRECVDARRRGARRGVAVAVMSRHAGKLVCLLGLERAGRYRNQYNLCAGELEWHDYDCYRWAAMRELSEEMKMDATHGATFDSMFRDGRGHARVFIHKHTPVYVARYPYSVPRRERINTTLALVSDDSAGTRWSHREMAKVAYFYAGNGRPLEGSARTPPVSSFAKAVLKEIDGGVVVL